MNYLLTLLRQTAPQHLGRVGLWLALLLPGITRAQDRPWPQHPTDYVPADQSQFRAQGRVLPAPTGWAPPAEAPALNGRAVFGWHPSWVPIGYAQQYDYRLLTHIAYASYRTTEQGALQVPNGAGATDFRSLVAIAHRRNPACRVLLDLSYQEPARRAALFGPGAAAARQRLVGELAHQVRNSQADGVSLDLSFQRQAATPAPRPQAVPQSTALDKRRADLDQRHKALLNDSIALLAAKPTPIPGQDKATQKQTALYARRQQEWQQRNATWHDDQAAYLVARGTPGAPADPRPAAFRGFVAALARALPGKTLALCLPATDSARLYTQLGALAPQVQLFVVKALDYTTTQHATTAPLQPEPENPADNVATSVAYYLAQGVPRAQLLPAFARVAKVWARYASPPIELNEVAPYKYVTCRTLLGWPGVPAQLDTASGRYPLRLAPNAASGLSGPLLAWADDSSHLAARYQWALGEQQLGGVGLWALSFDAPDAPAWDMLRAALAGAVPAEEPTPVADTTTAVVDTTPLPVAPDTTRVARDSTQTVVSTEDSPLDLAQQWLVADPLAHLLVFGLVLALSCLWLGVLVGAALRARYWVPFGPRRGWMLGLALGGALVLAIYASVMGGFSPKSLLIGWLAALAGLVLLALAYARARPQQPLP